ncbi:MAG: hypothetical protein KIS79_12755 [Burkholderiales bacterium]|nr:hypothetical protein [Burkholderiales bacterium]
MTDTVSATPGGDVGQIAPGAAGTASGASASPADDASSPGFAGGGGFSPEQQAQMLQWMVEAGSMTQAEADAMLKDAGIEVQKPEASAVDEHLQGLGYGFEPAEDPMQFKLPEMFDATDRATTGDIVEADAQVRGWLFAARLPAQIGSAIADEAARVSRRTERMTPADRAVYQVEQKAQLQKLWGVEYKDKLALAQQLTREVDKKTGGGLLSFLETSGAGDSALIIAQLYEQAHRLNLRHKAA